MKGKKRSILKLTLALAISSSGLAQHSNQSELKQSQENIHRVKEWPAAYNKSIATINAETTSGEGDYTVQLNISDQNSAYYGTYGKADLSANNFTAESLIYTNGPIIDTEFGSALSIVQSSIGLGTWGFGAQKGSNNSLADDFVLTEDFDISKIEFYAYQTGEATVSVTEAYIQIWDGDPSAGGIVVWGDLTTNRIQNVSMTPIYRVSDSDLTNTDRKLQRVAVETTGLQLQAGKYYIQISLDGTGSSGPWMPTITVDGEAITGDALQFMGNTSSWEPLLDATFAQGIPFEIYGALSAAQDECLTINPHYDWVFERGYTVSDNGASYFQVANDIIVDAGVDFKLESAVLILGSEWPITEVSLSYYESNSGEPGNKIGSQNAIVPTNITAIGGFLNDPFNNVYRVEIDITPFQFNGDANNDRRYWIAVEDAKNGNNTNVYWASTSGNKLGNHSYQSQNTQSWNELDPFDGNYIFKGECQAILGVSDQSAQTVRLFPNPASDIIQLSSTDQLGKISLYNLLGQEVLSVNEESTQTEINISHLPIGTYILKTGSITHRVLKK